MQHGADWPRGASRLEARPASGVTGFQTHRSPTGRDGWAPV
jgi:hypothetical protein